MSNQHQGMEQENYERLLKLANSGWPWTWHEPVEEYKRTPVFRYARIKRSGDTLLHIAAARGKTEIVTDIMRSGVDSEVLEIKNNIGNTPLHSAAATGKVAMCKCMVEKHRGLLALRNDQGETPLFLAALHGKKHTFLYLHSQCPEGHGSDYWRRNDGKSILHVAISREYFDLAFQIIKKYPSLGNEEGFDLANFPHKRGESALRLLANHPSAFESGSHFGLLDRIIYDSIVVEPLVEDFYEDGSESNHKMKHSDNYKTFSGLCAPLKRLFHFSLGVFKWLCVLQRSEQGDQENPPNPRQDGSSDGSGNNETAGPGGNNNGHPSRPNDYASCHGLFEPGLIFLRRVLGYALQGAFMRIHRIKQKKQKHTWAAQVMKELVPLSSTSKSDGTGSTLQSVEDVKTKSLILIAAKVGIKEMVETILDHFPAAIEEVDEKEKNAVLLAVENRQLSIFKLFINKNLHNNVFQQVDKDGNSILHLAATYKPGLILGGALQMQSEIKWYQFIKESLPVDLFIYRLNKQSQTDNYVFIETHKDLVKESGTWLNNTTQSCSVVATLIAAVAFATATTIPGGLIENKGIPVFEGKPMFETFATASLIALCFSFASLITFLAIATSNDQEDFYTKLTSRLMLGLTFLFISMASMLTSFFASLSYVWKDKPDIPTFNILSIACLPIALSTFYLFPLYYGLIRYSFRKEPERVYLSSNPLTSSLE